MLLKLSIKICIIMRYIYYFFYLCKLVAVADLVCFILLLHATMFFLSYVCIVTDDLRNETAITICFYTVHRPGEAKRQLHVTYRRANTTNGFLVYSDLVPSIEQCNIQRQ